MAMREECKNFQSRTYNSGEVARFCLLDLAPEAPWRCPDDCPKYERRLDDAGWVHGKLVEPAIESEPSMPPGDIAAILDQAEDIVNAIGPSIAAEFERQEMKRTRGVSKKWRWKR